MPDTTSPAPATNTDKPKTIGQVAYEAYGDSRAWKTATGSDMPKWSEQRPELCEAWEAAAQAVQPIVPEPLPSHGVQFDVGADSIATGGFGVIGDRAAALAKGTVAALERDTSDEATDLRASMRLHGARVAIVVTPTA